MTTEHQVTYGKWQMIGDTDYKKTQKIFLDGVYISDIDYYVYEGNCREYSIFTLVHNGDEKMVELHNTHVRALRKEFEANILEYLK